MKTLENYIKNIEVTVLLHSKCLDLYEVKVTYGRKRYKFYSSNWQAGNRIAKRFYVHDRVQLYGYSLKGAFEAFYKEFAKLHKEHSDELATIIR